MESAIACDNPQLGDPTNGNSVVGGACKVTGGVPGGGASDDTRFCLCGGDLTPSTAKQSPQSSAGNSKFRNHCWLASVESRVVPDQHAASGSTQRELTPQTDGHSGAALATVVQLHSSHVLHDRRRFDLPAKYNKYTYRS
jgi:hypothetical protein